tara:strand:- start:45 stop:359 length:315 start_codon:yes stop_codon:yes gene_type:complete
MKNSKQLKDIISKSNPDQIMRDFKRIDNVLANIDLMDANMSESDIKTFEKEAYKIKDDLEKKYEDHLTYSGEYDKAKEVQKIKDFQEEIKNEMNEFKSNLDSIK